MMKRLTDINSRALSYVINKCVPRGSGQEDVVWSQGITATPAKSAQLCQPQFQTEFPISLSVACCRSFTLMWLIRKLRLLVRGGAGGNPALQPQPRACDCPFPISSVYFAAWSWRREAGAVVGTAGCVCYGQGFGMRGKDKRN